MSRRFLVAVAVLGLLVGCEARSSSSSSNDDSSSSDGGGKDPRTMNSKVDSMAAEELAKSKQPAKTWLADTKNGTFKADKAQVVKVVDDCLAAGAAGAWVGETESLEGKQLTDHLFIELPTDAAKRAKIFEVYNKDSSESEEKDTGQKYIDFNWG